MNELINTLIHDFFQDINSGDILVYNEFSLQHELGLYLRGSLCGCKVQFERNIKFFGVDSALKKEIDISVFDNPDNVNCFIELKFPRNGQIPEQMFSFIRDIFFLEEISKEKSCNGYAVLLADDKLFWSGIFQTGIYNHFRERKVLQGFIKKPTGNKDPKKSLELRNSYILDWQDLPKLNSKYLLVPVTA